MESEIENFKEEKVEDPEVLLKEKYENLLFSTNLEGNFQKIHFIIAFLVTFSCFLTIYILPLLKLTPKYQCINKLDFLNNNEYQIFQTANDQYQIIVNEKCIEDYCKSVTENYESSELLVLIIDKYSEVNWITEYNTACSVLPFFNMVNLSSFVGKIIIPTILAYYADKIGRIKVLNFNIWLLLISFLVLQFSKSTLLTIITSFFAMGSYYACFFFNIYATECMSNEITKIYVSMFQVSLSLGGILYILIMYIFHNWRVLIIISNLINIFLLVFSYRYLTESPQYLLAFKKYEELEKVTKYVANFNERDAEFQKASEELQKVKDSVSLKKIKTSENDIEVSHADQASSNFFLKDILISYASLFQTKQNSIMIFKFTVIYIAIDYLFYGIMMNVQNMKGSIYINLSLIYFGRLISGLAGGVTLRFFSAKFIIIIMFTFCLICCVLLIYITTLVWLRIALLFTVTLSFWMANLVTYTLANDSFEISIKATVFSFLFNFASLADTILAPIVQQFSDPFIFFAITSAITVIVALNL